MDCPKCRLVNPASAERCDCGYDFGSKTMKEPYSRAAGLGVVAEVIRSQGRKDLIVGSVWLLIGTAVTVGTYAAARSGGSYTVAYGAVIIGLYRIVRGLQRMQTDVKL
jgi:hypothetical protein